MFDIYRIEKFDMNNYALGIYGAGGSAEDLYGVLHGEGLDDNWTEILFIDDTQPDGEILGCRHVTYETFNKLYNNESAKIIIAVGEPTSREKLYNKVKNDGYSLETYIKKDCLIRYGTKIGEGVVILDRVCVSSLASIGDNTWINGYTIIGHDVRIGRHCQISSLSIVTGHTVINDRVFIGASASIRENLEIGKDAVISMGAVVLKDVRENMIAIGNPAREMPRGESHRVFK